MLLEFIIEVPPENRCIDINSLFHEFVVPFPFKNKEIFLIALVNNHSDFDKTELPNYNLFTPIFGH